MEELWMHWAMKFSFSASYFFFPPRFHHAECIMLTNQGGLAGVKASHQNNANICLQIPFRQVVQTAVLIQGPLGSISMIQINAPQQTLAHSDFIHTVLHGCFFLAAILPLPFSLCPVHFSSLHFISLSRLLTLSFHHQRGMASLSLLLLYHCLPVHLFLIMLFREDQSQPTPAFFFLPTKVSLCSH